MSGCAADIDVLDPSFAPAATVIFDIIALLARP
jgi:hypothetical protein